jgi:hypothetical protein
VPLIVYIASAALLAAFVLRNSPRSWRISVSLLAGILTCALLLALLHSDPFGVWQWIMD